MDISISSWAFPYLYSSLSCLPIVVFNSDDHIKLYVTNISEHSALYWCNQHQETLVLHSSDM